MNRGGPAVRATHRDATDRDIGRPMRATLTTLTCLMMLGVAAPASAQSATKIGQHNAWGTYSYQAQTGKVCYVLTVPT